MIRSGKSGPLRGIRVVEVGQLIAGPWAGAILGHFGADVIKVEPPSGDPIRTWRHLDEGGTSYWWRSIARNKRSIVVDLSLERGRGVLKRLANNADVLIENFRPGKMEEWQLGPTDLKSSLIYARISGYGQTGPYSSRPGFASVCEGIGGFRHVNGFVDRPSVRPNLSLGDTLAGVHAALGIAMALCGQRNHPREKSQVAQNSTGCGGGEVIDTAIYEAVFGMMEGVLSEYAHGGQIRGPSGSTITGVAPSNIYPTADGKHVIIGANGESLYRRLCTTMEREDLLDPTKFGSNQKRWANRDELDSAIGAWTSSLSSAELLAALNDAAVPVGGIYDAEDMANDPHFNARGMIQKDLPAGATDSASDDHNCLYTIPGMCPVLQNNPGRTVWAGPALGSSTRDVLREIASYDEIEIDALVRDGAVLDSEAAVAVEAGEASQKK